MKSKSLVRVIRSISSVTKYSVEINGKSLMDMERVNSVKQWDYAPHIDIVRKVAMEQGITYGTELLNITDWSDSVYYEDENFEESYCEFTYAIRIPYTDEDRDTPQISEEYSIETKPQKSEHQLLTEALELNYDSEYEEVIKNAIQAKLVSLNEDLDLLESDYYCKEDELDYEFVESEREWSESDWAYRVDYTPSESSITESIEEYYGNILDFIFFYEDDPDMLEYGYVWIPLYDGESFFRMTEQKIWNLLNEKELK